MPKIDGLECWAYLSENGFKYFYADSGRNFPIEFRGPRLLFPKGLKPGECKRVVIPRAVVLGAD